ncbi:MAG: dTDP-glucose 4,6-dehydratase [Patescibacteria group bacterium]
MKIMVTGAAGFIGANYVHYVLKTHPEDSIIAVDALTYAGNLENLKECMQNPHFRFEKADICDEARMDELVKEADAIVHFAAETHVDRSIKDNRPFVQTNVMGTQVLLDAAVRHKKRFHHISTDEVFGTLSKEDAPFSKSSPYDPKNPYSATKAASDHLVRSYVNTHDLFATITNCSNNYGPYHFPEKVIPLFIRNLLQGKSVPVYGDGGQIRDWIYVEDHCRGVDMALRNGEKGETYLLGGKNAEVTNLELTKKLLVLTGRDESAITYVTDRPGHDRRYAIDYSFATEKLGWEPLVSLEEGLAKTMQWFEEHKEWVEHCTSGAYQAYYEEHYKNKINL